MSNSKFFGVPYYVTATGSTTTIATKTGATGTTYYITDISASSDKAGAIILVKDGSTVIWQDIVGATSAYEHAFGIPLPCTSGNSASVTIDGTTTSKANLAGYSIPN